MLAEVKRAVASFGYAGDLNPILVTYVALTSRLTEKPINLHVIRAFRIYGAFRIGKNLTVNAALQLMPDEAVIMMTASTPKAVIYGADDLRHKMIMMGEQDSLQGLEGNAATLMLIHNRGWPYRLRDRRKGSRQRPQCHPHHQEGWSDRLDYYWRARP